MIVSCGYGMICMQLGGSIYTQLTLTGLDCQRRCLCLLQQLRLLDCFLRFAIMAMLRVVALPVYVLCSVVVLVVGSFFDVDASL